jgi:DNA-binding PadR family transcriptional regulator
MKYEKEHEAIANLSQELSRGTLVLSVLLSSNSPQYGYSLVEELAERGIAVEQNTLYPLLRRLESQGLLESSWDTTGSRPRKYYTLSNPGERVRDQLLDEWRKLNTAIETIAKEKEE